MRILLRDAVFVHEVLRAFGALRLRHIRPDRRGRAQKLLPDNPRRAILHLRQCLIQPHRPHPIRQRAFPNVPRLLLLLLFFLHPSLFTLHNSKDHLAMRKPQQAYEPDGLRIMRRIAELQKLVKPSQLPPRNTWYEPDDGPSGSAPGLL